MSAIIDQIRSELSRGELAAIAAKVYAGERLSREDGIRLFESQDLLGIGFLADLARRRACGDDVYFINNAHINHTNVCQNLCDLCAFGREAGSPEAYTLTLAEVEAKARAAAAAGVTEIHIVGGLNPELPYEYYLDLIRTVRRVAPRACIQAFDAVEIDFIATQAGRPVADVLQELRQAGLDSLPGGGAEIFAPEVRRRLCARKIDGQRWLMVHETAHRLGIPTNATMLYGHLETVADRVDHLLALRELQDRTGGFLAFIPLAFHPANTAFSNLPGTTGVDDLKMLAISRLLLDNFRHIKAFWIMMGPKLAQVALHFGVNDLDGTVREERIFHDAGAATPQYQPAESFLRSIRAAGRIPVERDTLYREIRRYA
ncbi:aminofutalosine synthase MqnE [Neomoorella mulderi]|uniref:Aminodeoxyfutalosine synthase n=1 Tax=Moorella mulderi DSM 14980 TaxID=1122241 RepID=A0A151AZ65_9FIRM|nr:aminofutalosine synthase MqnE [Moorella mulderi]KYH32949.1 aminodeoxyfutalosine synthase [Moorella mulderi DSM 14980]